MPNQTTCTRCGCVYEAGSEEQANEQHRWCLSCRMCIGCDDRGGVIGICSAGHGPLCLTCVKSHNERHAETTRRDTRDPKTRRDLANGGEQE